MRNVVLLRHGQSTWNAENRFTGWTDVDLTERGRAEARAAASAVAAEGLTFDHVFTSVLKRAVRTAWIALDELDLMWLPVSRSWRLNERHYGALQGLNKKETARKHGADQVKLWRRSYSTPPPPLEEDDERHPRQDRRYAGLSRSLLPASESLEATIDRVLPYWQDVICPKIREGQRVLVVAHGNSLRGLVKHLDGMGEDEVVGLNIPTGVPLLYELDDDLEAMSRRYLGDPDEIAAAAEAVARQAHAGPPAGGPPGA